MPVTSAYLLRLMEVHVDGHLARCLVFMPDEGFNL